MIGVKISQARDKAFRIVLTILSLASSLDLMYILSQTSFRNRVMEEARISLVPMGIYIALFILLAFSYWFNKAKNIRVIRNVIIVVILGLTISSYLIAWPAFILVPSAAMTAFNELLLAGAVICSLLYNNLASFTSSSMVILLCLKFMSAFISLFYSAYILASLAGSRPLIAGMDKLSQNSVIILAFVLAFWNVFYACAIWTKFYDRWLAWILTGLLILEIAVPLISETVTVPEASVWPSMVIVVIIAMILGLMTYVNNLLKRED